MTIFNKPPFSISEHISQWISRGLLIPDLARAHRYLSVISYYRFSAYTLPFQVGDPEHHFRAGTLLKLFWISTSSSANSVFSYWMPLSGLR